MKTERIFKVPQPNNMRDVIYRAAEKFADNIAFVIKHQNENKEVTYENITYKKFLEDINKLGTALYKLGLKGKRVAIVGKNRYEWALAHLANLLGGIVSVPLDKDLQYDELERSLIRSKADAIIFDEKLEESIREIRNKEKTSLKHFISMTEVKGYDSVYDLMEEGNKELENANNEYINAEINNDALAILLFTSGTTSQSKAVMLSHRNVATNVYDLQSMEDINEKDTSIALLPFHHIFGSTCMVYTLACGVKIVFPDGLRYVKQNLCEYKVTMFVGVPLLMESIYKAVVKEIEKKGKTKLIKVATKVSNALLKLKIDIRRKLFKQVIDGLGGTLRLVIVGGAPADPKILQAFNNFGIVTLQGYGLSECSPVVAAENAKAKKNGTCGPAMPSVTMEVVNKDELGIGEIRVKAPSVMLGYYDMPEETAEVLKDGWYYTGDLGFIDTKGYVTITGRNKNMIVLTNGKKIFPEEIETLLNRMPLIEESMVFGMPSKEDKNDVTLSAKVVYNKEVAEEKYKGKSEEEIKKIIWEDVKELNKTFPRYKHIQNLIVSSEGLVKTTTKKVIRREEMKKILADQ